MSAPLPQQFNPIRDPAWRQNRVLELIDRRPTPGRAHRTLDDKYIKEYRRFRLDLRAQGANCRNKLLHKNPGLYYAHEIRSNPDRDWRALIEARILARETDDLIAERFTTYPSTIDWYEKLFFNVRDRLHNRSYILKWCVSRHASEALGADEVIGAPQRQAAWKIFGYLGGPLVLDFMIAGANNSPIPLRTDNVEPWVATTFSSLLKAKSTVAARFFTVNKFNVIELLNCTQQLLKAEEDARLSAGGINSEYMENINTFFEQIPVAIGEAAAKGKRDELLRYEATGAEPRASELAMLAEGLIPKRLEEKTSFVRPDPDPGVLVEEQPQGG